MPGRSFTIPRNQARNKEPTSKNQQKPISETYPKKSPISSTHENPTTPIAKKKKNFTPFRCVGCRATSQVSVRAPIADWQSKKKKQKLRINTLKFADGDSTFSTHNSCCRKGRKARHSCMAASFDDFVVSRKPHSAKGRVDIGKITPVEEEYEADDETGKLGCGHLYHIDCIKQWLMHKNSCPVCKSAAMSSS